MTKERKAPKDWENWEDFANCYDLVLFNNCTNLVAQDNNSYFEGVLNEWHEQHMQNCDTEDARRELEDLDEDSEEYKAIVYEYGECPECTCEPAQWYAIAVGDSDVKFLNDNFNMDIFYSEVLDLHILPVYHFGTAWSHCHLSMNKTTDND